jgi:hypothetical protein
MAVRVLIKKPLVPTKRATVILNKVQSCSALLCMLVVFIGSSRKSVLRYTFLMLDIRRLDALYCVTKDVRTRGYFSTPKGTG